MPDFRLKADPLPDWREARHALERWLLEGALRRSGGNMAAAAREIGITKVAVLHAAGRLGVDPATFRSVKAPPVKAPRPARAPRPAKPARPAKPVRLPRPKPPKAKRKPAPKPEKPEPVRDPWRGWPAPG